MAVDLLLKELYYNDIGLPMFTIPVSIILTCLYYKRLMCIVVTNSKNNDMKDLFIWQTFKNVGKG